MIVKKLSVQALIFLNFFLVFFIINLFPADAGSIDIRQTPYRFYIKSEEENFFYINIKNNDSVDIYNMIITVQAPDDWGIDISPELIKKLKAGDSVDIRITVTAPQLIFETKPDIRLIIQSESINKKIWSLRITGKPMKSFWIVTGIIVTVAIIILFTGIFLYLNKKT